MFERQEFIFKIIYFKDSGKYYTSIEVKWRVKVIDPKAETLTVCMPYAVAKLQRLRDTGSPGALPGLSGEGWNGPILIDCDNGYPHLLLPRKD